MSDIRDVIVVGAGPGGSSSAYYLAKQGLDVLLLDKADFPRDKTCGDGLTPRALETLGDMGLLERVLKLGRQINSLEIVSPKGYSLTCPVPSYAGRPDYLVIIPRLVLDNLLLEQARAYGAAFQSCFEVINIQIEAGYAEVRGIERGYPTTLKARVVIIATGANLRLLRTIGLLKKPPRMMLAARAYYEGLSGLSDHIQLYYSGLPLPGYGWVFPLSDSAANIGIGLCRGGLASWWLHSKPRPTFDDFVGTSPLQNLLAGEGASRVGAIKSYPLRADFATALTFSERVLVVGEGAGLVNPLTGEGIDYALESGKLAAEYLGSLHKSRKAFTYSNLAAYDQILRQRFQKLFVFCNQTRDFLVNPLLLHRLVKTANSRPDLKMLMINTLLGNHNLSSGISPRTFVKIIINL